MRKDGQPYTKKQIKSSRKLQGQAFMFDSWGYWDGLKTNPKNWKHGSMLRQRLTRNFGRGG